MLNHAADLSDANEYYLLWAGGTNARPWGTKADARSLFPEFELASDGMALTADLSGTNADATEYTRTITIGATESMAKNEWAGCTLRVGSNITGATGYGVIQSHDAIDAGELTGSLVILWAIGSGAVSATEAVYIVREGTLGTKKWGFYPQVRVLTPYQPVEDAAADAIVPFPSVTATGGRAATLPAPYTNTGHATNLEDLGVLLPLSFNEGIDGWGISDAGDSSASSAVHVLSGISNGVWTFSNEVGAVDHLNGGFILVDWELAGVPKRSWNQITDSTTLSLTVSTVAATWLGDGDPGETHANITKWTAWVPHFNDSPYAFIPGEGFTYPNHDMMPCSSSDIGSAVHTRPRNITGYAYGDTHGAMLVAAARLSATIGKRVNVVNLGITDSLLGPDHSRNGAGFEGSVGWYDSDDASTWAPSVVGSIFDRLTKLLTTVLPNAIIAENSAKPTKCLGIVFAHGENEALETGARQHYGRTQGRFIKAVRSLVNSLSQNPYDNGAEIPYVQPRIAYLPHAIDGTYARHADRGGVSVTINADTLNLVNSAIEENTGADEFAASVRVDDLPRDLTDPAIYSGVGEAELGSRIGDQISVLINHGLGHGSEELDTTQTRLIDICNLALAGVGEGGLIASLDEDSEEASLCKRFLPEARDVLLQARQWGFALRRRQLVPVPKPEPSLYQHWKYCYVMPPEALNAFNVLPPVIPPADGDFDYTEVTTAGYQTTFVANDGSGTDPARATYTPAAQVFAGQLGSGVVMMSDTLLPVQSHVTLNPVPYLVEQSPFGHRYIFTNEKDATLQYVAKVVDATLYSPLFASALGAFLGAKIAGPIIKGAKGETVSARLMQKAGAYMRSAAASDAEQQLDPDQDQPFGFTPDHLNARQGGADYRSGVGDRFDFPSGMRVL